MSLAPGTRLGHFEITAPLGAGGMGEVYRARDERLNRDVALKILPVGTVVDANARQRFRREALALSRINHPNIASIYDFDSHDGIDFIVMEFVVGETLASKLSAGALPEKDVMDLALQIAEALQEAHEHGIVHRDLKPGNIMVTKRGRAKVLDFGLAKSAAPVGAEESTVSLTGSGALVGTLPYMAPEQLRHTAVDARTDLYALGVVLYEMSTGKRPFRERQPAALAGEILHRPPELPRVVNPTLSPRLEAIVLKALRKNADERHQSAEELIAELRGRAPVGDMRLPDGVGYLPHPQTGFVGRDGEIIEGQRRLVSARLLTFTGSGGCGKTRLAIELAETIREQFSDGVWLVELAAVSDPRLVPQTVAAILGIHEQPGRPFIETLSDSLSSRRLLLVLDNCEHVLEAATQLTEALLGSCPGLKILATSREAFRIPGEISRRVPSLSLPDPGRHGPEAMKFEAIRLFVERATSLAPTFALTASNATAVAQICRQLDGIPLAIELAAARIRLLTPEEIALRLDDSFRLLTSGSGRALPRHQTLRALIDWSYDLLSDTERLLLRRLSVFAGGWSVEAAEAVCVDDSSHSTQGGIAIGPRDILDLMTNLVEKSLVIVEDQGTRMRCRFLETVRQYAGEKLAESGEAVAVRARHGDHFLSVTERDGSGDPADGLSILKCDHDNFRAALDWSLKADGRANVGLRIAVALGDFWSTRGYPSEGRMWLGQLLERAGDAPPAVRMRALRWLGKLTWLEGRFEESASYYEKALTLSKEIGDKRGAATALSGIGIVARHTREYDRARAALQGSLAIYRELEDRVGISTILNNLGALASNEKQIDRAISLYREALAISRELGDKWGIASRLGNLAEVTMYYGEIEEAAAMHRESLGLWVELGDRRSIAEGLEMFVETLCAQGRMELAAILLGAVEALREAIGCPRPPVDQETIQKALYSVRSALGRQRFDKAWSEGMVMGPEEAVARALEETSA